MSCLRVKATVTLSLARMVDLITKTMENQLVVAYAMSRYVVGRCLLLCATRLRGLLIEKFILCLLFLPSTGSSEETCASTLQEGHLACFHRYKAMATGSARLLNLGI